MTTIQQERARAFRDLHHRPETLVLLNAWDAASARVFELAGAPAIATTSAGVAAAFGYADGEHVSVDLLLTAVRQICTTVRIPVSVDLECGYGATIGAVRDTVAAVIDAGGIGINIEDGMSEPSVLVDKIAAIRELAATRELSLFINARTDVYLRRQGAAAELFDDAVRRLRAYAAAGADGLFVPGLGELETIARLLREVRLPLNIMAGAGVPPIKELQRVGVKRVSVGSGPARAGLTLTQRIANEVLNDGTYTGFLGDTLSHAEVNRMFAHD